MGRLILLVLVVALLVWYLRRDEEKEPSGDKPAAGRGELVRCAHCGVHLPRSEALAVDGAYFCDAEHARRGSGRG